jgi:hypothetical protein
LHGEHSLNSHSAFRFEVAAASPVTERWGAKQSKHDWKISGALSASGRGTGEELGVPLADDWTCVENGRRETYRNQHDSGCSHHDRSRGVHGNAQLAMVCSGFSLMDVHNLDNGEERQKDEAH